MKDTKADEKRGEYLPSTSCLPTSIPHVAVFAMKGSLLKPFRGCVCYEELYLTLTAGTVGLGLMGCLIVFGPMPRKSRPKLILSG